MKKIAALLLSVLLLTIFTSCSFSKMAGEDLVKEAQKDFASLDSARVTITDKDSADIEQELIYKYNDDDVMTFLYKQKADDITEYGDGEIYYKKANDEATKLEKGEEGFLRYKRSFPHPIANKSIILFEEKAITNAEVTETSEGKTVKYVYDVEAFEQSETDESKFASYEVVFYFDKEDKLINFEIINDIIKDGEEKTYTYLIEFTEKNSIEEIEKPFI